MDLHLLDLSPGPAGLLYISLVLLLVPASPATGGDAAGSGQTPPAPKGPEEIAALLKSPRPVEITVAGSLGLLVLLWLMVFKPF